MRAEDIAPCGMNCCLCRAYVRERKACPGCKGDDRVKPKTRVECSIKNCGNLAGGKGEYCFECRLFPCAALQRLDKRYRTKYGMSMIVNLANIKNSGMSCFLEGEEKRWTCPGCGAIICVHQPHCLSCKRTWR